MQDRGLGTREGFITACRGKAAKSREHRIPPQQEVKYTPRGASPGVEGNWSFSRPLGLLHSLPQALTLQFAAMICGRAGGLTPPTIPCRVGLFHLAPCTRVSPRTLISSQDSSVPPLLFSRSLCAAVSLQGHMNHLEPTAVPESLHCHGHGGRPGGTNREQPRLQKSLNCSINVFFLPRRFPRPRMSSSCTVPFPRLP